MAPDGILYAVDPFPIGRLRLSFQQRIAHAEVSRVPNGTVQWNRKTGVQSARDLEPALAGLVDFIFIDGDHSYEGLKSDWEAWRTLVAPAGIVAVHDSRSTPARPIDEAGSVKFTQERILIDADFAVCDQVDSMTGLRKTAVETRNAAAKFSVLSE